MFSNGAVEPNSRARSGGIVTLHELLSAHEDWLMARVLNYAKQYGFTAYTSTLHEAWRLSISGLTESISATACTFEEPPELGPDDDYRSDPTAAFGILEAERHRERGISLGMFLGLTKYYRQSYTDLVAEKVSDSETRSRYLRFVERCFDRIEIGFVLEWSALSETEKVTELQEANRRMTNEKNKYLTLMESFQSPVLLLDDIGNLENWNLAAARSFSLSEHSGARYYAESPAPVRLPWMDALLDESGDPEQSISETSIPTADGIKQYLVLRRSMLDVSDKFRGTVVVFHDISALKAVEGRLAEANKELEAFAYSVSHDLRAPLRAVDGFSLMLQEDFADQLGEGGARQLRVIRESVEEMGALIDGLLAFSRLGRKELHRERIDVNELVADILNRIRPEHSDRKMDIVVKPLPITYGDRTALREAFFNLIQNAVKYTSTRPTARIEIFASMQDGMNVYTVKDNGVGFNMKHCDKIFQVFQRLHRVDEFEGTGIGLALVQRIAQRHDGGIRAEAEDGKGATFFLSLPSGG